MNIRTLFPFLICALLAVSCSWRTDSRLDEKIRQLGETSELGTSEYVLNFVFKNDDAFFERIKPGKRKILYSGTAYLKAGIDMSGFGPENVDVDRMAGVLTVTLPKAKLLSVNIPEEEIKAEHKRVDVTRMDFSGEEKLQMRRKAEIEVLRSVRDLGIIEEAQKNAETVVEILFEPLGFKTIKCVFE